MATRRLKDKNRLDFLALRMSALGHKRTYEHLTGLVALLLSFEPLPSEQEIVERLGSWCHTLIAGEEHRRRQPIL
jgi:hypothetical protein